MLSPVFASSASSSLPPVVMESVVSKELQILQRKGLDSAEGRISFLENELIPFLVQIHQVNEEIQVLSDTIAALDANTVEDQITELGSQLDCQMTLMSSFLPVLETALMVEEDFAELDAIFAKKDPLTSREEEIVKRALYLCERVPAV